MKTIIPILLLLAGCDGVNQRSPDPIIETPAPVVVYCETGSWLVTGQSNMQWITQEYAGGEDIGVDVRQFHVYPDPLGGNVPLWTPIQAVDGFSWVGAAFGMEMAKLTGRRAQVFAAPNGGTLLSCWEEGGNCNRDFIQPFINEPFKGVIWWQGESDALSYDPEVIGSYGARLAGFFASLRANNPTLPIIMVGLQHYCASGSLEDGDCFEPLEWAAIRTAQNEVALADPLTEIVNIDSITSGSVHPTDSYDQIGRLLAQKAFQTVYNCTPRR